MMNEQTSWGSAPMQKGCEKAMNVNDEIILLSKAFQRDIRAMKTLPKEEVKKMAHENLVKVGIITEAGELTEPYAKIGEE